MAFPFIPSFHIALISLHLLRVDDLEHIPQPAHERLRGVMLLIVQMEEKVLSFLEIGRGGEVLEQLDRRSYHLKK